MTLQRDQVLVLWQGLGVHRLEPVREIKLTPRVDAGAKELFQKGQASPFYGAEAGRSTRPFCSPIYPVCGCHSAVSEKAQHACHLPTQRTGPFVQGRTTRRIGALVVRLVVTMQARLRCLAPKSQVVRGLLLDKNGQPGPQIQALYDMVTVTWHCRSGWQPATGLRHEQKARRRFCGRDKRFTFSPSFPVAALRLYKSRPLLFWQ